MLCFVKHNGLLDPKKHLINKNTEARRNGKMKKNITLAMLLCLAMLCSTMPVQAADPTAEVHVVAQFQALLAGENYEIK